MRKKVTPKKKTKAPMTQKPLTKFLERTQRNHLRKLYHDFFGKKMPDKLLVELEQRAIKASEGWPVPLSELGEKASGLLSSWIDNHLRNMKYVPKQSK